VTRLKRWKIRKNLFSYTLYKQQRQGRKIKYSVTTPAVQRNNTGNKSNETPT
jgi:hypothetical protein